MAAVLTLLGLAGTLHTRRVHSTPPPDVCLADVSLLALRGVLASAVRIGKLRPLAPTARATAEAEAEAALVADEISEQIGARCGRTHAGWRGGWRGAHHKPLVVAAVARGGDRLGGGGADGAAAEAALGRLRDAVLAVLTADPDPAAAASAVVRIDGRAYARSRGGGGRGGGGGADAATGLRSAASAPSLVAALAGAMGLGAAEPARSLSAALAAALAPGARAFGGGGEAQPVVLVEALGAIDVVELEPLLHGLGEGGELARAPGGHGESHAAAWLAWLRGPPGSARRALADALAPALGARVRVTHATFVLLVRLPREGERRWCSSAPADADDGEIVETAAASAEEAAGGGDEEETLRRAVGDLLRCAGRTHAALPEALPRRIDHLFLVR